VDSSSYAVSRFGKRRNIRSGTFGTLENLNLSDHYDLVICSDTLFYLTLSELQDGLKAVAKRTRGVAFLELYTRKDSLIGDFPQEDLQNVSFYRKLLKNLGFLSVGSHCYLGPAVSDRAMEMEKGECS
jgi:hypothetical protein